MLFIAYFQCLVMSGFHISTWTLRYSFVDQYWVYQILVYAFFWVESLFGSLPSSQTDILESIMTQCTVEGKYPPGAGQTSFRFSLGGYSFLILNGITNLPVGFRFFKNPIQAACDKLWKHFADSIRGLHITSRSSFVRVGLLLVTASWMTTIIYLMVLLERIRQQLQKAAGPLTQDSQWGFGQVIAVISWAPVLHEISVKAFGLFL